MKETEHPDLLRHKEDKGCRNSGKAVLGAENGAVSPSIIPLAFRIHDQGHGEGANSV
jgi:hypothetical protein